MESGIAGTNHFQIYLHTERLIMRQIINFFFTVAVHPNVEMASRWKQALMYCCKAESRISETYYTNIPDEIAPPVVPKLV